MRVGNAAADQMQLDVYGELLDTLHAAREAELQPREEAWRLQEVLLGHLERNWQALDRGIWEVRGEPHAFTHSRVMAWVAFDRAIASAERFGLDGPVDRWKEVRGAIHDDICANGFDTDRNSFVQHYGGDAPDASLLLMPQVGFLPPDDPRVIGTIAAIERELMRDGFVLRYSTHETDDGLAGEEGAFLACSFWLADAYVLCGRHDDARALFDRLLAPRTDLGVRAEQSAPRTGRLVGNFPQGLSHIGLISTAPNLVESEGPAKRRARQTAPRETKKVATEKT